MIASVAFLVGFCCVMFSFGDPTVLHSTRWWTTFTVASLVLTLASATMYYPNSVAAMTTVLIASALGLLLIAGGIYMLLRTVALKPHDGWHFAHMAGYLGGTLAGWLTWTIRAVRQVRRRKRA